MAQEELTVSSQIYKFVDKLTHSISVDEIILYGSHAKGTANQDSDIDLAIVSSELDPQSSIIRNVQSIRDRSSFTDFYVQLVAFPSDVFYKENYIDSDFIREIKQTGKIIYNKSNPVQGEALKISIKNALGL